MLEGLELMKPEELTEIARLIELEGTFAESEMRRQILAWMGRAVGTQETAKNAVERAVLEWVAGVWGVHYSAGLDTDDLERLVRLQIAKEATEFLNPRWRIACAMIAVGAENNRHLKLRMLEEAASLAVPSRTALKAQREEWESLIRAWSTIDPAEVLDADLETLRQQGASGEQCLTLGLALSLVDGRIAMREERLCEHCADALGMSRGARKDMVGRLNELFWSHQNKATPVTGMPVNSTPVQKAAHAVLHDSGALEALATESRRVLVEKSVPKEDTQKKSTWSRVMGAVSGLSGFFSNKVEDGSQAFVARIVYHTILKQHAEVVASTPSEEPLPAVPVPQTALPTTVPTAELPTKAPPAVAAAPTKSAPLKLNAEPLPQAAPEPVPEKEPEVAKKPSTRSIKLDL